MRRAVTVLLLWISLTGIAQAGLLQCTPPDGARLRAFVDGFGRGETLPEGLEVFRAFIRAGSDEYEMQPEHTTHSSLKDGVLRVEARRMLSAGEAAEFVFEGRLGEDRKDFPGEITFRSEGRVMHGTLRCKLI